MKISEIMVEGIGDIATKLAELKVQQQRPKIEVMYNIADRKDNKPFPLSYKDTGGASTGGQVMITPQQAQKFIKFYEQRADDEKILMQKALSSVSGTMNLLKNLGMEANSILPNNPDAEVKSPEEKLRANLAKHANEDTAEAYTPTKDKNDYDAKAKVLQSIQLDPATSKDPELRKELIKRKKALEKDKAKLKETVFIDKMKSFIVENYELENFTEAMTKIASTSEIYVDMDGVLADFFGDWAKLMGVDSFRDIKDAGPALAKIRATDDFWLKLPLLPEAKKLLSLIKEVKGEYNICTSPLANDPNSEPHKREWIKKNLAFFPPKNIHITHDKPQFAKTNDGAPNILIDDYGVNINAWEAAGGIGFKHKDHKFERTAKEIKQHMQEPVSEGAEITMWTNPEYQGADVDDKYYKKQPVKIVDVSKLTPFEPADKMDPKDNHDNMIKFVDKIKAGEKVKPIVIVPHEGKLLIVDGHHRYFAHKKAGVDKIRAVIADPKDLTWRDDVPESVKENFADGKKPGRKGLAKRSGVNTKASVSSLRKTAKSSSGEKQRMAHWMANMKAGKAKKKGK